MRGFGLTPAWHQPRTVEAQGLPVVAGSTSSTEVWGGTWPHGWMVQYDMVWGRPTSLCLCAVHGRNGMEKCGALISTCLRYMGGTVWKGVGPYLVSTCVRYMGGGSGILTTSMVRPRASGVETSTASASRLISHCGSRGSSVQDKMT